MVGGVVWSGGGDCVVIACLSFALGCLTPTPTSTCSTPPGLRYYPVQKNRSPPFFLPPRIIARCSLHHQLLDTFHTYVNVPMSTSPPCATEGGFLGNLAEDAQIAICCANHGTYSDAGNMPYATAGTEGLENAYGLVWTEHSGEWALGDHGGTPCESAVWCAGSIL